MNLLRTLLALAFAMGLATARGPVAALGPVVAIDNAANAQHHPAEDWGCPAFGGRFLTAYEASNATDVDIYGRLTNNAGGAFIGAPFVVGGGAANQLQASVTENTLTNAGYLVAYTDRSTGVQRILVVSVDCNGVVGVPHPVDGNPFATVVYNELNPDIVCGTNTCWVVWQSDEDAPGNMDIWGARVDATGTLITARVKLTNDAANQESPAIDYNPNASPACGSPDSFLVVWQDRRAGNWDIYAKELDDTDVLCTVLGVDTLTYAAASDQQGVDLAYGVTGGLYQVVWQDKAAGLFDVSGVTTGETGAAVGGSVAIAAGAGSTENSAAVAYNTTTNQFLTVWNGNGTGDFDVRGQLTSAVGALVGANFNIQAVAGTQEENPVAASSRIFPFRYYVNWNKAQVDVFGRAYL